MKDSSSFLIAPKQKVRLHSFSTHHHKPFADKDAGERASKALGKQLAELQEVLYASQQKAVLIVLQGPDTAGKDGAIRHIFSGINPQGCEVASFKPPTPLEARHDFLWRCHSQMPPRGSIGIFNRSHYEDVLWPRVHEGMSRKQADQRLDHINAFEAMLADNDVVILKFFLHISQQEQTLRLQSRIDHPDKRWKLDPADFAERSFWSKYRQTYEQILSSTCRKHAPWFVIPSDHKWFRDVAISQILVHALGSLKLKFPESKMDIEKLDLQAESISSATRKAKAAANADDHATT